MGSAISLLLDYTNDVFFFSVIMYFSAPEPEAEDSKIPLEELPRWVKKKKKPLHLVFQIARKENWNSKTKHLSVSSLFI